jgi:hypothetical protein
MTGKPTIEVTAAAIGAALGSAGIRYLPYLPDTFSPPVAVVAIETVDYHASFGASGSGRTVAFTFTVFVIVSRVDDRSGISAMEDFMSSDSPTSVATALEADTTYGGLAQTAICRKSGPLTALTVGGVAYVSVPFVLDVWV